LNTVNFASQKFPRHPPFGVQKKWPPGGGKLTPVKVLL
jgi:hypothetical protein